MVRQFFIFTVSKRTTMFVLQMKSKMFFIQSKKKGSIHKNRKLGSVVGHRIDYNGVGVLRGQLHIPSKS